MSEVNVNSRYLSYNKGEVEQILEQVETLDNAVIEGSEHPVKGGAVAEELKGYFSKDDEDIATDEEIRDIVRNYVPDSDSSDSSSE